MLGINGVNFGGMPTGPGPGAIFTGGGYGNQGAFAGPGGSAPGMIPGMMDVYNQTLGLNEQNYQNILNTYSQGQSNLASSLPNIYAGYGAGLKAIKSTLGLDGGGWGVAAPAAEQIKQSFAQQRGSTDQQLINAGLGNTTVRGNLQNQNTLFAGQAYAGLGAQLAQTYAGYQSQFNLADLAAQQAGLGMQTDLSKAEGSTLGGYRFANTAGNLTGQYSQNSPSYGGGGGGGFNTVGGGRGGGGSGGGGGWGSSVPQSYYTPAGSQGGMGGTMGYQTAGGSGWGAYVGQGSPYASYTGGGGGWGTTQGSDEGTGE